MYIFSSTGLLAYVTALYVKTSCCSTDLKKVGFKRWDASSNTILKEYY